MPIPVVCRCGAVNTFRDEIRTNQPVEAAVHGTVVSLIIARLPIVRCCVCDFTAIDGQADGSIRWALIESGILDCDEVHSNAMEQIRMLL